MADDSFLASVDHYMVLERDDIAFFNGTRVDLKCVSNSSDSVTAVTLSKAVPYNEVTCGFPAWVRHYIQPGDCFSVVDFKIIMTDGTSMMTSKGQEELLPILHAQEGWRNVAEGFAGIGGWSHGSMLLGNKPVLMVEHDEQTAFACAYTWQIPAMYPSEAIECVKRDELPTHFALIADVNCVVCQVLAGIMKIGTWLWSPPCQPWSKAGRLSGMQSPEGVAFVRSIMGLRLSKPRCVNIENVPGLVEHKDYQHVKHLFDLVGYQIACSSVDKVHPLLPIIRKRWLCTVLPTDFVVAPGKKELAFKTVIPNEVPGIGKETPIGAAGCVQSAIQHWEFEQVVPSEETLELLSRYDLLPVNVRKLHPGVMTKEQVLQARTKSLRHCLPNVMAMQGSQHTLPIQHLQEKGLHAFLIDDGTNKRFALPFEIAVAMGFKGNTTLPMDFVSAWRITGNALSVPHAALQCFRAHILMGSQSPFVCNFKGCFDLCKAFRDQQILLDDCIIKPDKEWMVLEDWVKEQDEPCHRFVKASSVNECPQPPKAKRQHMSPTWEYHEHESSEIIQAVPQQGEQVESYALNATRPMQGDLISDVVTPMPEKEWQDFLVDVAKQNPLAKVTKVIHKQGVWAHFVWIDGDSTIGNIIQQCLPHACENHFANIQADGTEIRFGTKAPQVMWKQISFEPLSVTRIVQTSVHPKSIPVMLDVTWKFTDLVAYIAAETAVLSQNMSVYNEMSRIVKHDLFVLADPSTHFLMVITPGFTDHKTISKQLIKTEITHEEAIPDTVLDLVPTHSQDEIVSLDFREQIPDEEKIRLAFRCPKWGSIRTAVFNAGSEVGHAIAVLFPHFHASDRPCIAWNEVKVSPDALLKHLVGREEVELFFPGEKQWPVTALIVMRVSQKGGDFVTENADIGGGRFPHLTSKDHLISDPIVMHSHITLVWCRLQRRLWVHTHRLLRCMSPKMAKELIQEHSLMRLTLNAQSMLEHVLCQGGRKRRLMTFMRS